MSSTGLGTAYANVIDYGALVSTGSRAEEDANRGFIQDAINSGRHVLFPAGTYRFTGGAITFLNADQRCTFLAGAVLQPGDSSSHVVVSGARQVLTGLRLEVPADVAGHSPLLDVKGASGAGDGVTDDTSAIQRAIDTGLHVVFPGRAYRVTRRLTFGVDDQRVTLLAGAKIVLVSSEGSVHITGKRQTFTGLWIQAGLMDGVEIVPNPCLLVQGADDLLLQDPRVDCSPAVVPVRVKDTAGVTIVGGSLRLP